MQSLSSLPPYAMDFNAIMIETKFGFPDYHPCPPKRERIRERFRHVHFPDCNFCFSFGLVWFCLSLRWCMLFPFPCVGCVIRAGSHVSCCGTACILTRTCHVDMYLYVYCMVVCVVGTRLVYHGLPQDRLERSSQMDQRSVAHEDHDQ